MRRNNDDQLGTTLARTLKFLYLLPTLLTVAYFGFIASDRYVAEARFVVRTAARPIGSTTGFGSFLQIAGLGRSQDDVYSVQSFLNSRDAIRRLSERLPLQSFYGGADADFLARYPSVFFGSSLEELYLYLKWMISTEYSTNSGISTLKVEAFKADEAKAVADTLLDLSEETVNRLNERIQADAIKTSDLEVTQSKERLIAAQVALTNFRNGELTIDPASSSVIVTELVARLSAELAQAQTQLRETNAVTPDGPTVAPLQRRVAALEKQISDERAKISDPQGGLAEKLAVYERLLLEAEFAKTALASAVRANDIARVEAHRQQLYLQRIVEPQIADHALAPQRLRICLTVFGGNLLALLVGWLLYAGINERVQERQHA